MWNQGHMECVGMSSISNTETHVLPSRPVQCAMLAAAGYSGQMCDNSGLCSYMHFLIV